ncbi:MAG TPA: hypothetical protein VLD86_15730 [Ilumatobacteraceae bacterium]|nr:hypothetical protein [Ilumatobacteraceae bacterium]
MTTRQPQHTPPEQLALLPVSELPVQFRLDQRTRQRGLAHIAAIRRQLAAKAGEGRSTTATTNHVAVVGDQAA